MSIRSHTKKKLSFVTTNLFKIFKFLTPSFFSSFHYRIIFFLFYKFSLLLSIYLLCMPEYDNWIHNFCSNFVILFLCTMLRYWKLRCQSNSAINNWKWKTPTVLIFFLINFPLIKIFFLTKLLLTKGSLIEFGLFSIEESKH